MLHHQPALFKVNSTSRLSKCFAFSPILEQKWNKIGTNLSKLQTYIGGHISVDDIVLVVVTSCNKIESIELISFESSKASMAAPHSRQSHQNFIT